MATAEVLGPEPARRKKTWKKWTRADETVLVMMWGSSAATKIAEKLGRSREAVCYHATAVMGLGSVARGTLSLRQLSLATGYVPEVIRRAAKHLGIVVRRSPSCVAYERKRPRRYMISLEDGERIVAWLREQGRVRPFVHHGKEWGQAGRPDACLCCGRTDREHKAFGLCKACHQRKRKAERGLGWGTGSIPERCRECGTNASPHRGRGLCMVCYERRWREGTIEAVPRLTEVSS